MLLGKGEKLEALGLLQAILPKAKVYTTRPHLYGISMGLLLDLGRNQEAHEAAAELAAFAKANYSLEDPRTL